MNVGYRCVPLALILFLLNCCAVWAQDNSSASPSPSPIAINVDLVQLLFTVSGKDHKFLSDLEQSHFKCLDNGEPPRSVLAFESRTESPLRIGLLLDVSNSTRSELSESAGVSDAFLRETIHSPNQAFILTFDEVSDVVQNFTDDSAKLKAALSKGHAGGGTALWDAVYYASRELMMKNPESGPIRRVLVVVSDGSDNQSRASRRSDTYGPNGWSARLCTQNRGETHGTLQFQ